MMRILKKWRVIVAVVVVCAAVAAFGQTNDVGTYVGELRQTLRLRLQPDNVDAYLSRGNAKGERGQFQDAIADYDQALQLWPDDAFAYVIRGETKICLGQFQDAIADFNQALQLQPDDASAYVGRASAMTHLGQYDDASADLD